MFLYLFSILVSISIIFGIHWGIQYLKMNYTVKKCKEVNKFHSEKYEQILRELATPSRNISVEADTLTSVDTLTSADTLTEQDTAELHMDLDAYINSINNS
jgi:hypothetical protein